MSYTTRHTGLSGTAGDVANAVVNVATDPCLGQVAALVNTLHLLEQKPTATRGALGATSTVKGIGLCKAVTPLKIAVWVKRHPISVPVAGIAIVGAIFGLGYLLGSERR